LTSLFLNVKRRRRRRRRRSVTYVHLMSENI
jgi:hypothetical protein